MLLKKVMPVFWEKKKLPVHISFHLLMVNLQAAIFSLAFPEGRLSGDGVAVLSRFYFCII